MPGLGASWDAHASNSAGARPGHCSGLKWSTFGTEIGPQLLPPAMSLLRSSLPSAGLEVRADSMRLLMAAMTMMPSTITAPRRTVGWCPAPWSLLTRSALIRRRRRTAGWRAAVIRGLRRGCCRRGVAAAVARELGVAGAFLPPQRGPAGLADRHRIEAWASPLSDAAAASYRAERRSDPLMRAGGDGRQPAPCVRSSTVSRLSAQLPANSCPIEVEPVLRATSPLALSIATRFARRLHFSDEASRSMSVGRPSLGHPEPGL